jgi:O-acetyl-ADP-ribose deacetylase (regulator of RNase III)
MIEFRTGNIFDDADATFVVIPVNTLGVMGAGLAKEMKQRFPRESARYQQACHEGIFNGNVLLRVEGNPKSFFFVATKEDWRKPSNYKRIEDICLRLVSATSSMDRAVVAVPALGCGRGGLHWPIVRSTMVDTFIGSDKRFLIYAPT